MAFNEYSFWLLKAVLWLWLIGCGLLICMATAAAIRDEVER